MYKTDTKLGVDIRDLVDTVQVSCSASEAIEPTDKDDPMDLRILFSQSRKIVGEYGQGHLLHTCEFLSKGMFHH